MRAIRAGSAPCLLGGDEPVPRHSAWAPLTSLKEMLEQTGERVFTQAIPSSPELREQAAEAAITALNLGVHVVTATKTHLLSRRRELDKAARTCSTASPPGTP